jgi:hypothetical protein
MEAAEITIAFSVCVCVCVRARARARSLACFMRKVWQETARTTICYRWTMKIIYNTK